MRIGDVVWHEATSRIRCGHCDGDISGFDENWKEHSLIKRSNAHRVLNSGKFGSEYKVYENENLEIAEIFCRHCNALLAVELYLVGEPLRWTYRTLQGAVKAGYDARQDFLDNPDKWISFGAAR